MGKYDIPAFVDKIIEVTGRPKVTLMGYSQGGAQIFYALSTNQDWFADRVHRYVALSACHYFRGDLDYEIESARVRRLQELGLYNYFGGDESSITMENCGLISQYDCEIVSFGGYGYSTKSYNYFYQIAIAQQF